MQILILAFSSIILQNIVFTQFLGLECYRNDLKNIKNVLCFGSIFIIISLITAIIFWCLDNFLLIPLNIQSLQIFSLFLLVFAVWVLVKYFVNKFLPFLSKRVNWLSIVMNSAIWGVGLLIMQNGFGFSDSVLYSLFSSLGFIIILILFAGIQERLDNSAIPKAFKGLPSLLICLSIISLAFMCFNGIGV